MDDPGYRQRVTPNQVRLDTTVTSQEVRDK
jgi:hypothetical protein